MAEAHIDEDVEAPPLSESIQHNTNRGKTNEASLSEISESMQRNTLWGNANEANNFTIFRTPHNISQSKKNLFEPSVISIGPFHRGQPHLRAMEEQKWWFLQNFLSCRVYLTLDLCISEMILLEKRTRGCYSETVDLKSNAFVEMMLLDGCFVLEYFINLSLKLPKGENLNSIFAVGWNSYFIMDDLLLLENQIPFFIVEKLFDICFIQQHKRDFVKFIAFMFLIKTLSKDYRDSTNSSDVIVEPPAEIHHLVHLCYHYLVPKPEKSVVLRSKFKLTRIFSATRIIKGLLHRFSPRPKSTKDNISSMVIRSATELKQKGITFKQKSKPKHMLDITFEYGVLKIPRLAITDDAKPLITNLLAFEHSKYGNEHSPFGRFVSFLDKLVNTPNDVTILQECGIIENWLGSEEEMTHFINHVTEFNYLGEDHYLEELYTEVNRYIESRWNKQRVKLIRDYFSSPWATLSVVAAFILLLLTLVQSFFAVFAYFIPPSP